MQNEFELIRSEAKITFALAAKENDRSVYSFRRWAINGISADGTHGGARIKLGSIRHGGRRVTSREAVARFMAAINKPAPSVAAMESSGAALADAALIAAGI
jgi:hypothetical protein